MSCIEITLYSDMCPGSGSGYAHIVDTDICTDEYGLPMIPARRLKGCLRDAAVYYGIDQDVIDALFGRPGMPSPGMLYLENGYLKGRDELVSGGKVPSPERVTQLYSGIRTQTAIDRKTGTARTESLRTTRVVYQYLPDCPDRTVFVFAADCPEKYKTDMETICKAMRHMGMGRTRGLGAVKASFVYSAEDQDLSIPEDKDDTPYVLPIHVLLRSPLMLPDTSDEECSDHISGTMLRGALAGLWFRKNATMVPDDAFNELFLEGRVSYGDLYISDKDGNKCEPIPGCMGKIKSNGENDGKYASIWDTVRPGEQLKPLRGVFADAALRPRKIEREAIFHHVHSGEKLLYKQEAVSAGQYFRGEITGPHRLLIVLQRLLRGEVLRFGHSRNAQYAACQLLPGDIFPLEESGKIDNEKKFEYVVFTLVSDVILCDENGVNTCDPQRLIEALLPGLGYSLQDADGKSILSTKSVHGYHAKRGMREIPRIAFSKGSTLCIAVKEEDRAHIREYFEIGEYTSEGFGRVHAMPDYAIMEASEALKDEGPDAGSASGEGSRLQAMVSSAQQRATSLTKGMEIFEINKDKLLESFTAAFTGRAILMTQQAVDGEDILRRYQSVKDKNRASLLTGLFDMAKKECESSGLDLTAVLLTSLRRCRIALKGAKQDG